MDDRHPDAALPARGPGAGGLSRLRVPERLPGLVDAHAHLQHPAFDADREAVLERAQAAGIVRILVPGYDRRSSEQALSLAAAHPDLLHAAVGIHPHHAAAADEVDWRAIEDLAADPAAVAVGEIGLDFFRNLSPPPVQLAAFERQLALAASLGKPVIVHDRDAHRAISDALLTWAPRSERATPGVLHCFSGDAAMATRLASAGFLVSFALPVSFDSNHGPREAAAALPADAILVETDSPWLGLGSGRNEPTTTLRVAAAVARLRGVAPQEITTTTTSAYQRLLS